ncbi:MAG: YbdD/YjiX family protein [Pseudomonadota bacterium]
MAVAGDKSVRQFLSSGLSLLRGVTGDDAYDKYLAHMHSSAPQETPMTAREFFRAQLENKWNCISGCC